MSAAITHDGLSITITRAEDGRRVVEIDTDFEPSEEGLRVWVNEWAALNLEKDAT